MYVKTNCTALGLRNLDCSAKPHAAWATDTIRLIKGHVKVKVELFVSSQLDTQHGSTYPSMCVSSMTITGDATDP